MPKSTYATRVPVGASVILSMAMIAIEATIVLTAMPQVLAELGGLDYYSWIYTALLLTQNETTAMFGMLADLYGRKPTVLAGVVVFLIAPLLCGIAHSMPEMIAYRLIQGIGAGAIQSVAITVIVALFPSHECGKLLRCLAIFCTISAILGPVMGELIIRDLSWAWISSINIPIDIVTALGFWLHLHEKKPAPSCRLVDVHPA